METQQHLRVSSKSRCEDLSYTADYRQDLPTLIPTPADFEREGCLDTTNDQSSITLPFSIYFILYRFRKELSTLILP